MSINPLENVKKTKIGDNRVEVFTQFNDCFKPQYFERYKAKLAGQPWVKGLNIDYNSFNFANGVPGNTIIIVEDIMDTKLLGAAILQNNGTEYYLTGEVNWFDSDNPNIDPDVAKLFLDTAIEIVDGLNGPKRLSCVTFASKENHGTLEALYKHEKFYFTGVDGHSPAKMPVMSYRYRANKSSNCNSQGIIVLNKKIEQRLVMNSGLKL